MSVDYENMMTLEKGHLVSAEEMGLDPDGSLAIRWEVPFGSAQEYKDLEKSSRVTLTDFTVDFKTFSGVWRSVKVRLDYGKDGNSAYITHIFAKGYATSLSWDEARELEAKELPAETPSGDIKPVISRNQGQRYSTITWLNLDNHYVESMVGSLANQFYMGKKLLVASSKKMDDGSGSVTAVFADPDVEFIGFEDYLTQRAQTKHYLRQIPQKDAQDIINNWKDKIGKSAVVSGYSGSDGTVDLILSESSITKDEVNGEPVQSSCDTTITTTIGFGLTSDEVEKFINDHKGTSESGKQYEVKVEPRSDGLYNVEATKRIVDTTNASHSVKNQTYIGHHTTIDKTSGFKKSWLDVTSDIDQLCVKGAGITSDYRVERNDDCTFGYEISKRTDELHNTTGLESGTLKETAISEVGINASELDISSLKTAPTQGQTIVTKVTPKENGLFDYEKNVVTETQNSTGSITSEKSVLSTKNVEKKTGSASADVITTAAVQGTIIESDSELKPNGLFDTVRKTSVSSTASLPDIKQGTLLKKKTVSQVYNGNTSAYQSASQDPVQSQEIQINGKINLDGTIDWVKEVVTSVPASASFTSMSAMNMVQITIVSEWFINQINLPGAVSSVAYGQEIKFSNVEINPDGTYNYVKTTTTSSLHSNYSSPLLIYAKAGWQVDDKMIEGRIKHDGIVSGVYVEINTYAEIAVFHRKRTATKRTTIQYYVGPHAVNDQTSSTVGTDLTQECVQVAGDIWAVYTTTDTLGPWQLYEGGGSNPSSSIEYIKLTV